MDKQKLYNLVIKYMLDKCNKNIVLTRIRYGKLALSVDKATINVIDDAGNTHYLVHVPYDFTVDGGSKIELHGNMRNNIASNFISNYTYEDIVNNYFAYISDINQKIDKANKTKHLLDSLASEIHSKENLLIEPLVLADNNSYSYYIQYCFTSDNKIHIYLGEDSNYRCLYNGKWLNLSKMQLISLVSSMQDEFKEVLKQREDANKRRKQKELNEHKLDAFVNNLWGRHNKVIIKLKSSYQCIYNGMRYSVGDGKEGKFYNIGSKYKLKEYLIKKGVTEYYVLYDDNIKLTDNVLKNLHFSKIF